MSELLKELRKYYGEEAVFRDGQEEAIQAVLAGKRSLVVQKTGWGKSLIYFLSTKILRERGKGITLIISPLLALMNNQITSANKLGLKVCTINSGNTEDWDSIYDAIGRGEVDALIISPERLANDDFKKFLMMKIASNIAMFVVDEAHCISDWGHDFRPDYRRIVDLIRLLPHNVPVLATTATANDRVIDDIKAQLGEDIIVSRGALTRESLSLQVIHLDTKEERLAWILKNINEMPGTGIVYCLTVADCRLVNKWLASNGISSEAYYARVEEDEGKNKSDIVAKFLNNEIKVLVATVAFGMGFDKPDIGFVIHFQKPGNVVAYYQQIGRAGRDISDAYAIMLCGDEDDHITDYFIRAAFPTEGDMNEVIAAISNNPGLGKFGLLREINMSAAKLDQCLKYLLVKGDIYLDEKKYYKKPIPWNPDLEKSREITRTRYQELEQMNDYAHTDGCYMEFIAKALDDPNAKPCGKCAHCLGKKIFDDTITQQELLAAQTFVKSDFYIIEPRKRWPNGVSYDGSNNIPVDKRCQEGWVLSNYGDAGWGRLVIESKYHANKVAPELLTASVELLRELIQRNEITWVTNISSLNRPNFVKDFAVDLALELGLSYHDVIIKTNANRQQKELHTSFLQCGNVMDSFEIVEGTLPTGNVLLVDDMVDSRWTLTVCGYKLIEKGAGKVYPFALANSAGKTGDN